MRALVIGYGVMGNHHARVLRELGLEVATVDPHVHPAADFGYLGEVPANYFDVACVATPIDIAPSAAIQAMNLGMDVLIEKPMAPSFTEAFALAEHADALGRKMAVGYVERGNPAVQALKANLGSIGRIGHIEIQRLGLERREGSPRLVYDLAVHDLDVLHYLGLAPRFVAVEGNENEISICLSSPCPVFLRAGYRDTKHRTITVIGEGGMLALNYQTQTLMHFTENGSERLPVASGEPLVNEWTAFLNGSPLASVQDGIEALHLAMQVENALKPVEPQT